MNKDVPMYVGFEKNLYNFEGMMDEVGDLHIPHTLCYYYPDFVQRVLSSSLYQTYLPYIILQLAWLVLFVNSGIV